LFIHAVAALFIILHNTFLMKAPAYFFIANIYYSTLVFPKKLKANFRNCTCTCRLEF